VESVPFDFLFQLLQCSFVLLVLWVRLLDHGWWRCFFPAEPVRKLWLACKVVYKLLLYRSRCHYRICVLDVARRFLWQCSCSTPCQKLLHPPWLGKTLLNVLVEIPNFDFGVW
jgi:hypothetical protein